jgi:hypothetical protein
MSVEPPLMRDVLNGALNSRVDASGFFSAFTPTQMTLAELLAGSVIVTYAWGPGDIRRYGGSPAATAAINDAAINASIAQAKQTGGSAVRIEDGQYTVGGAALLDSYVGDELFILGKDAGLVVAASTTALQITNSENVTVDGLEFSSAAASGTSQRGIYEFNCGRIRILRCDFRRLTYGVYWDVTKAGLSTGAFPIPNFVAFSNFKACAAGVYCAPSAEYVTIANNTINDCTLFGITIDAGNIAVLCNTVSGNDVGVQIDGSATGNGDHGAVVGNTINHNAKANLVIKNMDYSMVVAGNNMWAAIVSNYGVAPFDSSFGLLLSAAFNVTVTGNTFGNNIVNVGINATSVCTFTANNFIADNGRTLFNIKDLDGTSVKANRWTSNTFGGALVAGANNNDPEQMHPVGGSGEPAFQNAWVNFGAGFRAAGFFKDGTNTVHVTGVVKTGVVNTAIFTLPSGFRPSASIIFAICSNSLFGYVQVDSTGDVTVKVGSNVFAALDGVSFRAEN